MQLIARRVPSRAAQLPDTGTCGFVPAGMPSIRPTSSGLLSGPCATTLGRGSLSRWERPFLPLRYGCLSGTGIVSQSRDHTLSANSVSRTSGIDVMWKIIDWDVYPQQVVTQVPRLFGIGWPTIWTPTVSCASRSIRRTLPHWHNAQSGAESARRVTIQSSKLKFYQAADHLFVQKPISCHSSTAGGIAD